VRYKCRTIAEVLGMTVEEAAGVFAIAVPSAASSPAPARR
jgi:excinuclease UvrABC ATPase subunit